MRILILGGGAVGALVARRLIREKNEVVIVEGSEERHRIDLCASGPGARRRATIGGLCDCRGCGSPCG